MSVPRHTARGMGRSPAMAAAACLSAAGLAGAQMQAPPPTEPAAEQPSLFPTSPVLAPPPPLIAAPPAEAVSPPADDSNPPPPSASPPRHRLPPREITSGDGGPIILGEHSGQWKLWDLRSFSSELSFYGEVHDDRQTSSTQPEVTQHSTLLRGTTNLSFESYIGHKNFIDLRGNFSVGYEDQTTSGSGADDHTSSPTDFYDISARILDQSFMPVTAYSRRDELIQNRDFAGTLKTVTTEHGAIVEINSEDVPTRMRLFHRETSYSESLGLSGGGSTQDSFQIGGSTHLGEHQSLEFNYTFDHIDEESISAFQNSYDRHDGTLSHTYTFGAGAEDSLRSSLQVYNESGLYSEDRIRLDEQLTLKHSPNLRSNYFLTMEDVTRAGQETRQINGSASVTHRLFDSLVSSARAGGSAVDVPGAFTSSTEFISGSLDYTKRVPLGQLNAGVGLGFNHQDNGARGGSVFVFDEQRTFTDPFDIIISRRNIVGPITVTTLGHVPLNDLTDYTVRYFPDRVEIHREAFGSILNGQTVLVTYEVGPEPSNSIDSTNQSYSVRYTINEGLFSGLSLYSNLQITSHSIDAVDPSRYTLDDVADWRYGVEYRIREWTFLLERENRDSTISPYDKTRYQIRYERRFSRDATLSINFNREEVDYRLDGNRLEYNNILARWTQRLSSKFDLRMELEYRDEQNVRDGDSRGFRQTAELNWHWRQTTIFGSVSNSFLTGGDTDRLTQTFTFGLTRSF